MSREITYRCDCCHKEEPSWRQGSPLGWIRTAGEPHGDWCAACHACPLGFGRQCRPGPRTEPSRDQRKLALLASVVLRFGPTWELDWGLAFMLNQPRRAVTRLERAYLSIVEVLKAAGEDVSPEWAAGVLDQYERHYGSVDELWAKLKAEG